MICAVFFSSDPHPDTLSCECQPFSSWIFWKTCAALCSISSALLLIAARQARLSPVRMPEQSGQLASGGTSIAQRSGGIARPPRALTIPDSMGRALR
ncbi:hypothetical protein DI458_34170 [Burkholderia contaminans]|nr:hypothetical protein [Burkholderia contaminans]MBA9841441.1 hypothetical protein [Burkholderia contaminans]MBA9866680.1 hypothetical protein [Burkholderia contaminans]MBA9909445.1 hypothetical protein [Burkholderia contaminans]MBA9930459.1 hypothetical protein [Burkholderia contaminans]